MFSSVAVSIEDAASDVSFVLCVTGHMVVSSEFIAGFDSSGESFSVVVDDDNETLAGDVVEYSKFNESY